MLPIEDISRMMDRKKFLVRPSYQRSEVINLPKASAIIESIILGVTLPAIFFFKREDGVSEVIDGQQRLLTILGYIGKSYRNEDGETILPKKNNFPLKNLRILSDIKGKKFHELQEGYCDKILDFELFIVTIEERLNPEFDPIDLFIRLNDKPYPIKEHSFEMWNSWVDKDIITSIQSLCKSVNSWFYLRNSDRKNFRDRMENEEILLTLTYLNYKRKFNSNSPCLDVYQKETRLNTRIRNKKDISDVLTLTISDISQKDNFLSQIKETKSFINKIKAVLLDKDPKEEPSSTLKTQLDKLLNPLKRKTYRRTYQDFYILWTILSPINYEMIRNNRRVIKDEISEMIRFTKDIPENLSGGKGFKEFVKKLNIFHSKYEIDKRCIRLNETEIRDLIKNQNNICPVSGSEIYFGDEIEVDHIVPLAIGGKDDHDNLQILHKDVNRKKGCKEEFN